jgi:hypothetical protein
MSSPHHNGGTAAGTEPSGDDAGTTPTWNTVNASPWMTLDEVATYLRVHYETVRRAAVEYQQSKGKSGLKTSQRKPNTQHRVLRVDADRWIDGQQPAKGRRTAA